MLWIQDVLITTLLILVVSHTQFHPMFLLLKLAFILLKNGFISNIGSSHSFSTIPKNIPVLYNIYLISNFVSKFKFHTPILLEVGLHSWRKSLLQDRSDFSKRFEVSISLFHFYLFSLSYLKHISSIGIQWIESRVFGFYILLLFILAIEQHCKPNNITTEAHLRG